MASPTPYLQYTRTPEGDLYLALPEEVVLPDQAERYLQTLWHPTYTWSRLAFLCYGDPNLFWVLWAANPNVDPWLVKVGDPIRVLRPEFISAVVVGG